MNTNSNKYIIIYATLLVVVVAFLLAFVSQSLGEKQAANVALDKKKQILASLNIRGLDDEAAFQKYREVVEADAILDGQGAVQVQGQKGGEQDGFRLSSADFKAGRLALYVCRVDGATKYVIPVYGMGLWGAISGYIALDEDRATVYGAYFNHEGETAGLGAEIKDNRAWQEKFQGKKLFAPADAARIALAVEKKVDNPDTQVDAVTGATLTSNGVRDMLQTGLAKYIPFLASAEK